MIFVLEMNWSRYGGGCSCYRYQFDHQAKIFYYQHQSSSIDKTTILLINSHKNYFFLLSLIIESPCQFHSRDDDFPLELSNIHIPIFLAEERQRPIDRRNIPLINDYAWTIIKHTTSIRYSISSPSTYFSLSWLPFLIYDQHRARKTCLTIILNNNTNQHQYY